MLTIQPAGAPESSGLPKIAQLSLERANTCTKLEDAAEASPSQGNRHSFRSCPNSSSGRQANN